MSLPDGMPQASLSGRDNDKMHMVGHEAIDPNRDLMTRAPLGHEINVGKIVRMDKEGPLSPVSSLCNVMRDTWHDNPGDPCHNCSLQVVTHPWRTNKVFEFQNLKAE
jgi:hypothetical protein